MLTSVCQVFNYSRKSGHCKNQDYLALQTQYFHEKLSYLVNSLNDNQHTECRTSATADNTRHTVQLSCSAFYIMACN